MINDFKNEGSLKNKPMLFIKIKDSNKARPILKIN